MAALVGMILLGACASDASPSAEPTAVVRSAARTTGADWAAAEVPSRGPGSPLVSACGDPRRLGDAFAAAETVRTSPVRQRRVADPGSGEWFRVDGFLRVAAARFPDASAAQRAVASVSPAVLETCVVAAVNDYLKAEPGDDDDVDPATASDFATRQVRRATGGRPAVVQSAFEEEVVGGYDNSRTVNLALARSGATVAMVTTAIGQQSADPGGDADEAESLAAEITRTAR